MLMCPLSCVAMSTLERVGLDTPQGERHRCWLGELLAESRIRRSSISDSTPGLNAVPVTREERDLRQLA